MWQVACHTWHMTCDMWHLTRDRYGEVNLLSKFQLPSSYRLGMKVCWRYTELRRYFHKVHLNSNIIKFTIQKYFFLVVWVPSSQGLPKLVWKWEQKFELVDITGYLVWATQNIPAHHNVPTNQNVPKSPLAPLDCPCAEIWIHKNFCRSILWN